MNTSVNYTGRSVDLSLFPTIAVQGGYVDSQLSANPMAIAGLSALAQNFSRILLTPLGNYLADPTMGTNFYMKVTMSPMRYPSDVMNAFLTESLKAIGYMAANYTSLTPPDEMLSTATLTGVDINGTSITLTIEIVSQAGTTVVFLLPVNWLS